MREAHPAIANDGDMHTAHSSRVGHENFANSLNFHDGGGARQRAHREAARAASCSISCRCCANVFPAAAYGIGAGRPKAAQRLQPL